MNDKLATLKDVVRAAFARGTLHGVRTAAAELVDLALVRFKRDPLSNVAVDRSPWKGTALVPTLHDLKQALRRAVSQPAYSATVIGVLALGIAVNTVVFSVADAALFRGLPYPNGARLTALFNMDPGGKFFFPGGLDGDAMKEWRQHPDVFDSVEGWNYGSFVMLGGAEPQRINGAYVTPGLFDAIGVRPILGRGFEAGDGEAGRDDFVLISNSLWRERFGGSEDALGKALTLNDRRYRIVGVMPPHFRFPASQQLVWLPTPVAPPNHGRLQGIAIIRQGLTQGTAQERLDTIAAALMQERPQPAGWRLKLRAARGSVLNEPTKRAIQMLSAAVVIVLLIACANLANLCFAQALMRKRELAVRAALGASRWRLIRELLVEHLLLGAFGGAAGLTLALWGVHAAIALAPAELTVWRPSEIRIDGRVLLFTAAATFASALLFGILPAWRASRTDAGDALKTRTSGSLSHGRLRASLVVAEVALSVVLLTGAALLIRSFTRLTHLNPGFEPRGLVAVELEVPADRYPAPARRAFLEGVTGAIRRLPGVTAVSAADGVPPTSGTIYFGNLEVEGRPPEAAETVLPSMAVEPSYFATLRLPIVAGRGFTGADPPLAAIVGESLARRLANGGSALGVRFRLHDGEWYTVVGVAGDVRQERTMERETSFEMYLLLWPPTSAAPPPTTASAVRSAAGRARAFVSYTIAVRAAEGASLAAPIKQAVWSVDAAQPVGDVLPVEALLSRSLSQDRFATALMGTFAGLALLLAAAGLYAVLAHLVAQRRQEIGIRVALGAATVDVARIVVGRSMAMTALGIAIGLTGAWTSARILTVQLYDVAPHDPLSFAAVPAVLFGVALLASWLPARRALSVDPASALRAE